MLDLFLIEKKNSAIEPNAITFKKADPDTSDLLFQVIEKLGVDRLLKSIGKVFDRYKFIIEIASRGQNSYLSRSIQQQPSGLLDQQDAIKNLRQNLIERHNSSPG